MKMAGLSIFNSPDERKIKEAFSKIKSELDDHLDAINGNSNELGAQAEYIAKLEDMIAKLKERLDEAELKLSELSGKHEAKENYKEITLSQREQEIFFLLYSREGDLLDYRDISRNLGLTEQMVRKSVQSIIDKGVPLIKKYFDDKVFLVLDGDFRNLQAKENIIKKR